MQHLHDSMNNLWEEADQLYNEICEDEAGERAEVAERGHFVRYLAAYGYTEEEQQVLFARVALGERNLCRVQDHGRRSGATRPHAPERGRQRAA